MNDNQKDSFIYPKQLNLISGYYSMIRKLKELKFDVVSHVGLK